MIDILTDEFRQFSAELGKDPLRVQGPGGNTSIKRDGVMWIKASGTELANAEDTEIFVAVDRVAALAEAKGAGDGTCKATVLDPAISLRPSIETTFHAALEHSVVAHTHSVATLVHAISPEGRAALDTKLSGLPFVRVPYAKPGLPLTGEILARITPQTRVIVLENHGLIVCGDTVEDTRKLMAEVEDLLQMPVCTAADGPVGTASPPAGREWSDQGWIAKDRRACELATSGSLYPDHVVFLGPGLPKTDPDGTRPAVVEEGTGVTLKTDATASQRGMLLCLSDVLSRLPEDWTVTPIGPDSEAELLDWDAEKYRQALAARA